MKRLILIVLLAISLSVIFSVDSYSQGCTRNKPLVTSSPSSISGPPDNTFIITLTIRNEDTQACGFTSFNIRPDLPTGWTSFIRTTPISIFPQQSELVSVDIKVPKEAAKEAHKFLMVADSENHATAGLKGSAEVSITIKEEPKTCTLSVDNIVFRKADTDVEKIIFCLKEKINVDTKISLKGNTQGQVSATLFVDGKVLDSSDVTINPDNFVTINFKNAIDTTTFGKSTPNVKVAAKAACASSEATREKRFTIDVCDPSCLFTTSIAAPLEKQVGQDIIISIYTRNIGNKENLVAIEPAVCKGDCIPMVCEVSSVKLEPEKSKSYSCSQKVKDTGSYTIETKIFACGKEETQIKSFVGVSSSLQPTPAVSDKCKFEALPEFRCSGSIRQRLFTNSDCSTTWVYDQYCPDGCSNGLCISSAEDVRGFEPVISLSESFESKVGEDVRLAFDLENLINSPAKFDIKVSGKAAGWVSVPSSVIIGEKAKETITFSASVPGDVEPGEYDFTVTVSTGARSSSKSSLIEIAKAEQPILSVEVVFAVIGGLLAVFVLLRFLQYRSTKRQSF